MTQYMRNVRYAACQFDQVMLPATLLFGGVLFSNVPVTVSVRNIENLRKVAAWVDVLAFQTVASLEQPEPPTPRVSEQTNSCDPLFNHTTDFDTLCSQPIQGLIEQADRRPAS